MNAEHKVRVLVIASVAIVAMGLTAYFLQSGNRDGWLFFSGIVSLAFPALIDAARVQIRNGRGDK